MSSIRFVCTHDALPIAETLMRLLDAEGHDTHLCYGRPSLAEIPTAREAREIVLMIWSPEAPGAHYMLEWASRIPPERLVEIARAHDWPRIANRAPVIDFLSWRGERGGRAWNALAERLRHVSRAMEPVSPQPRRAAMALGLASLAAIGGAVLARVNTAQTPALEHAAEGATQDVAVDYDRASGVGGALRMLEPASIDDNIVAGPFGRRFAPLPPMQVAPLVSLPDYDPPELRDATLVERITALNPINRGSDS